MSFIEPVTHDPDWYAPFRISLGIRAGGFVFVSGQAGIDHNGRTVPGGFSAQARQALANLDTVLHRSGGDRSDLVKVTIMVTDMAWLPEIVALREEYFRPPYPADTLVQVAGLAQPDWLVEIDAVALAR